MPIAKQTSNPTNRVVKIEKDIQDLIKNQTQLRLKFDTLQQMVLELQEEMKNNFINLFEKMSSAEEMLDEVYSSINQGDEDEEEEELIGEDENLELSLTLEEDEIDDSNDPDGDGLDDEYEIGDLEGEEVE